ncbi:MAG: DUF2156 domain-containing protein [Deltaproteobacteria bacterium]
MKFLNMDIPLYGKVPSYPSFRTLDKSDKPLFDREFRDNPPEISEYTFTNIYAWRQVYKFRISLLDGFIILLGDKESSPQFFNPIGSGDPTKPILRIINDTHAVFVRIPEPVKDVIGADKNLTADYDQDNSDYVFSVQDLVTLKGKKYDGKRNLIRKFKSLHPYEYIRLKAADIKECLDFEEGWCRIKDCDGIESLSEERGAIRQMLENFSDFNLIGAAIRAEGRICAVALAEKLNPETLVMHALKADPGMGGLYQAMNNEFMTREAADFKYVNMEQDLGVEGLRKAKLSYHPAKMIKKYTLRLSGTA